MNDDELNRWYELSTDEELHEEHGYRLTPKGAIFNALMDIRDRKKKFADVVEMAQYVEDNIIKAGFVILLEEQVTFLD